MSDLALRGDLALQAAGAFLGALGGFLAVTVKDRLDRRRARRRANRISLSAIEKDGSRALGLLHESQFEIRCIKQAVAKHEDKTSVPLVLNRCTTIPMNPAHWEGLRNISLINDVFQYEQNIRKFNDSVSTLNHFLDLFSKALLAKTVDHETYRVNLARCIENLDQIRPFIDDLIEETFRLIAAARLMLSDDKTVLERMGIRKKPQEYTPEFRLRVEAEVVVLRKEVEEVSSKDKKRIDKITGKPEPGPPRGQGPQQPGSPRT
jgi:hypothetical protein